MEPLFITLNPVSLALLAVISKPFQWFIAPLGSVLYGTIYHLLLVPTQMLIRIIVYTFIYLPLKPFLLVMNIDESRTLLEAFFHFRFFLINLVHFAMVSIFLGVVVGIVTGFNLKLISHLLTELPKEQKAKYKLPVVPEKSSKKSTSLFSDLRDQVVVKDTFGKEPQHYFGNKINRENYVEQRSPEVTKDLESNEGSYIFDDDDGYIYSPYNNSRVSPFLAESSKQRFVSDVINDDSVIPEENESENPSDNMSNIEEEDYSGEEDLSLKNDLFSLNRNDDLSTMHTDPTSLLRKVKNIRN